VAVLWPTASGTGQLRASEAAARSLSLRLQLLSVQRSEDLGTALAEAQRQGADALIGLPSPLAYAQRTRLVELAARHRLPTMYNQREFIVEAGGLMSYGPNLRDLFRRAAIYADKILKGAKPTDLPVEQPTKFELLINVKTAKALSLTIPPSLLARADEVVE
jgi:putative tryptophan/tyrosine transport system substrate-binding protein